MEMTERIRRRFVRRAVRLARYRRLLAMAGLGLAVFGWVAAADAWTCYYVIQGGRLVRICR